MPAPTVNERILDALAGTERSEYEVVAAGAAAPAEVAAFESALGFAVPTPLGEILTSSLNGLAVLAREELWPASKELDVGPAWTFWPGLVLLGVGGADLPGWADATLRLVRLHGAGVVDVAPAFAVFGDGERTWGLRRDGTVVLVWEDGRVDEVGEDLFAAYRSEVVALHERTAAMVELRRSRGEL